jgi:putative ABC transport system ATP-binding protein
MRIDARGVSHLWNGAIGLHPIDVAVGAGELVVVRGRSGSGKSTLLALLAGLCTTQSGTVAVNDRAPALDCSWSSVALVPQVLALAIELSVGENITDSAPHRTPAQIQAVLELLDVADLAQRTIAEISMGQQQRVAVARAIAATPAVILADEPTSFQDDVHTSTVVRALRTSAAEGSAILVATHDAAVIGAADRVIDVIPR